MSATADEMACQELVELVTEYLEGTLDLAVRARFDAHMADCPGCELYLDQMRVTLRLLGSIPQESLHPEIRSRLLDAFGSSHADSGRPERVRLEGRRPEHRG